MKRFIKILASHFRRDPRWEAFSAYNQGFINKQFYRESDALEYAAMLNFSAFLVTNGSEEYEQIKVRRLSGDLQT